MSKRCDKGKSCKATCIFQGDDCIEDLPDNAAEAIDKVIERLNSYVSRGGEKELAIRVLERLEEKGDFSLVAKRISQSLDNMGVKYPDPKEREERINKVFDLILPGIAEKGDTGKKQFYTPEQITFLSKNKGIEECNKIYEDVKSGKLKTPEEINSSLKPLAEKRRVNDISDEQVDLAMSLMPPDLVRSLSKQGEPAIWGKWADNQSSLEVPEGGHTSKNQSASARARLITRIGLQEGMRDVYTGQRLGFGDIDLEHIVPSGVAKAGAEVGSNFGLTSRLNNRAKGDVSPESWRSQILSRYETKGGRLTPGAIEKLRLEELEARKYNDERSKLTGGVDPKVILDIFKGIDGSSSKPNDKSKLKDKALSSLIDYTATYMQGYRANRGEARRRIYVYRGTSVGESILDSAAKKIDEASKRGDTKKVEKIYEILRSGAGRINAELDEEYGPRRLDNGVPRAAEIANSVRTKILEEIEEV